ncbi:hypothetical protein PVK06_000308 [Gossypium arboreum]|uniref:Uncharacterized protein n=1 Tax=Gossypium arboreum TaxID=29729 RepID=A0ABR0QYT8_GOSAR|nr:hypothetical protein PVK06_000308 [Gossypium arboreum]
MKKLPSNPGMLKRNVPSSSQQVSFGSDITNARNMNENVDQIAVEANNDAIYFKDWLAHYKSKAGRGTYCNLVVMWSLDCCKTDSIILIVTGWLNEILGSGQIFAVFHPTPSFFTL